MALKDQVKRLKAALKSSQAATRAEREGRLAAEKGKAAVEKGKAAVEKGKAAVEKGKAAVEKERDKALETVEKMTETAEAAELESDDYRTQITYLKRQVQAVTALSNGYGLRHTKHDRMWDNVEELDRIIADPDRLKSITGLTPGQFQYHLNHFEAYIKSAPDMPLFRGDPRHAGKPGNRCKLYPRHVFLLTAMRTYTATNEDAMEPWFGIVQSNISNYLNLGYRILGEMTVTADFMTEMLKECKSPDDIREIMPHIRILVDGTHIERVRPGDSTTRKAAYSGKKKRFTFNVQVMSNGTGLVLNLSPVVNGSIHDYTLFKEYLAGEGAWLLELADMCKEYGMDLEIVVDLGYQGIKKDYGHQFKIIQGIKRKRKDSPDYEPKHGGLTEEEVKYTKEVSKKRIYVEHSMPEIKRFKLMRGPFVGTAEELRRILNVVTGLANTNHLWDHVKDAPGLLLTKLTGMIDAKLAAKTVWT